MTGWQIRFYEDRRGKSPALEYLDALPARDRAKANNALRLLEEFGAALNMPHARHIEVALWELRLGDNRLFYCLLVDKVFVILHGYRKKSMKAPDREIQIALRRMRELLEE